MNFASCSYFIPLFLLGKIPFPLEAIQLRVDDIRVFYDIVEVDVEILAIVPKTEAADWLAAMGEVE